MQIKSDLDSGGEESKHIPEPWINMKICPCICYLKSKKIKAFLWWFSFLLFFFCQKQILFFEWSNHNHKATVQHLLLLIIIKFFCFWVWRLKFEMCLIILLQCFCVLKWILKTLNSIKWYLQLKKSKANKPLHPRWTTDWVTSAES